MKVFCILGLCVLLPGIICPPVDPKIKPKEGGSEDDEAIQETGLEYDKYLREIVTVLEEDEGFKKKLEAANISDIKSGKIAIHLEMVAHHVREKLDEIKRKEVDRLRMLAREKMKAMNGTQVLHKIAYHGGIKSFDERVLHHLDVENPHTFEMKDLEKLIVKATKDLDELDQKRRKEFKEYEMEKEHERREHLKELPEEERKKEEAKFEELKKKHKEHPKLHHPGSKKQLEEVWEEKDHMDPDTFDPKTFFKKHDINGDDYLDVSEVESLFQEELDKVYDPENPEDDMEERYEEMNRMREHVMKEIDRDHDGMVSQQEFMDYSHNKDFDKDEGWDTLDEQEQYSEDDLREYERMLAEEEQRRQQQGAFGHAQPGVVMHPPDPNVQHMNQQGMPPPMHQQGMPPPMHQQGIPPQHMQGMPPQQHMQGMPPQHPGQGMPQQMPGMQQGMQQGQQQGHYSQDQLKFQPHDQQQQQQILQQQQQHQLQMQQHAAQQQAAQAAHQQAIQQNAQQQQQQQHVQQAQHQQQAQQPVQQQAQQPVQHQQVQQQAQQPVQQQQQHVQQQQQQQVHHQQQQAAQAQQAGQGQAQAGQAQGGHEEQNKPVV